MSIFKSKILTFVVALFCIIPFSFAFVGCGENKSDDNGNNNQNNTVVITTDAAYSTAVSQLQSAFTNSTMIFDMSYAYGLNEGESTRGIIKYDNGKLYSAQLDAQGNERNYSYIVNGIEYGNSSIYVGTDPQTHQAIYIPAFGYTYWRNTRGFDGMSLMQASSVETDLSTYKDLATFFNPTTPMQVVVMDGNVTLTIGADVAAFANKLLANFKTNYNTTLTAFLNQLINDLTGQQPLAENAEVPAGYVTVDSILDNIFANFTNETTVADVINALPDYLKIRADMALDFAADYFEGMTVAQVKAMPVLPTLNAALPMIEALIPEEFPIDLNDFIAALQEEVLEDGQEPGEGEMMITSNSIKNFIKNFLDENSLDSVVEMVMPLIQGLIGGDLINEPALTPEEEQAAEPTTLDGIVAILENVSVSQAGFSISVTFDANNNLKSMNCVVNGAVRMGQSTMEANATINIQFSNIGTTTIELPAINYYYEEFDLTAEELADHLNQEETAYVFELKTAPFAYDIEFTKGVWNEETSQVDQVVYATYNKTTNTLTIDVPEGEVTSLYCSKDVTEGDNVYDFVFSVDITE